jgi:hypothetical protein
MLPTCKKRSTRCVTRRRRPHAARTARTARAATSARARAATRVVPLLMLLLAAVGAAAAGPCWTVPAEAGARRSGTRRVREGRCLLWLSCAMSARRFRRAATPAEATAEAVAVAAAAAAAAALSTAAAAAALLRAGRHHLARDFCRLACNLALVLAPRPVGGVRGEAG